MFSDHKVSEVQKLMPINSFWVVFQNAQMKSSAYFTSPPLLPPALHQMFFLQSALWRKHSSSCSTPPQLPRDNPCSEVFVVLTLQASDPQRRTLCADTGVFWLHSSMSLSMKHGGGGGRGKDDYEDTQDKGLLLLWWQRIIGVIFPWGNCFKSKAGLVSPTLKPAYPLNSSPSVPSLLF